MPHRSPGFFSTSVGTKLVIGITGFALFLYLVIHIAGNLMVFFGPAFFNRYAYVLESNPLIVGFYVLSMIVVGSHLWHGIASSLQSLGLDHPVWTPRILTTAKLLAFLIAGGFAVIAMWV